MVGADQLIVLNATQGERRIAVQATVWQYRHSPVRTAEHREPLTQNTACQHAATAHFGTFGQHVPEVS
jgi:hypothetical protein